MNALRHLLLCTILLCAVSGISQAQTIERVKSRVDDIIDKRPATPKDSSYVRRPLAPWVIRLKADIYGNELLLQPDQGERYRINTVTKATVGISANYRGLSLALSLNPLRIFSDRTDLEYHINYYGNRIGADLQYGQITHFHEVYNGESTSLEDSRLRSVAVNAYYIFNHRRFSYPAVFSQSWLQTRSAGSPIVSLTAYGSQMQTGNAANMPFAAGKTLDKLELGFIALGAGYAYNYVTPNQHWLLHLSAVPSATILRYTKLYYGDEPMAPSYRPFNIYLTGRIGILYSWQRYFVGLTGVVQNYDAGTVDDIRIRQIKAKVRTFVGLRL